MDIFKLNLVATLIWDMLMVAVIFCVKMGVPRRQPHRRQA